MKPIVPLLVLVAALRATTAGAQAAQPPLNVPTEPTLLRLATTDAVTLSLDSAMIERTGESTFLVEMLYDYAPELTARTGVERRVEDREVDCAGGQMRGRGYVAYSHGREVDNGRDTTSAARCYAVPDDEQPIFDTVCRYLRGSFAAQLAPIEITEVDQAPELANVGEIRSLLTRIGRSMPRDVREAHARVRFRITADGRVDPATLRLLWSSVPALAEWATRVSTRMRFSPGTLKGQPQPVWVTLPVTFQR